jgi:hypothetical protein
MVLRRDTTRVCSTSSDAAIPRARIQRGIVSSGAVNVAANGALPAVDGLKAFCASRSRQYSSGEAEENYAVGKHRCWMPNVWIVALQLTETNASGRVRAERASGYILLFLWWKPACRRPNGRPQPFQQAATGFSHAVCRRPSVLGSIKRLQALLTYICPCSRQPPPQARRTCAACQRHSATRAAPHLLMQGPDGISGNL